MNLPSRDAAFDLTGQTALITGGGTGLGFGMARCLVASGARVVPRSSTPLKNSPAR
jgi:gluconate 5-dehydrogenase